MSIAVGATANQSVERSWNLSVLLLRWLLDAHVRKLVLFADFVVEFEVLNFGILIDPEALAVNVSLKDFS